MMGTRKIRSSLYIANTATVTKAAALNAAASVAKRLTASTSVAIGGAEIVAIETPSADATVSIAGGMIVCASPSTGNTYTLPTSTAGTVFYIFFSTGPDSGVPGTNSVATRIIAEDVSDTRFADLISTAPADKKQTTTRLLGTTGDHFIVVALSSSQWNIMSYSSNAATSSGV